MIPRDVNLSVWIIGWAVFALAVLVALGFALYFEKRGCAQRRLAHAWLPLRLTSLPAAAVAGAAAWIPARLVHGPEALAAFYLLLFTATPAIFYATHLLVGAFLRPAVPRGESARIATHALIAALTIAGLMQIAQSRLWLLARQIDHQADIHPAGESRPWPLTATDIRTVAVPDIGTFHVERWPVPATVKVERIELKLRDDWVRIDEGQTNFLCRFGNDFHAFWLTDMKPATWRIRWSTTDAGPFHSERITYTQAGPANQPVPTEVFAPRWMEKGVELPLHLPQGMISLSHTGPDGREQFSNMRRGTPASPGADSCVARILGETDTTAPVTALNFYMWRYDTQQDMRAHIARP